MKTTTKNNLLLATCLFFWLYITASLAVYFVQHPFADDSDAFMAIPTALIDYVFAP
jgi:hypothetical protein